MSEVWIIRDERGYPSAYDCRDHAMEDWDGQEPTRYVDASKLQKAESALAEIAALEPDYTNPEEYVRKVRSLATGKEVGR